MVGFSPFIGSVIRSEFTRRVPAPAFDSMSRSQRALYLADHPESYTLVTRSPNDGGVEDDASVERLIQLGGEALDRILEVGAFETMEQPAFFLYRLKRDDLVQVGIVGLVDTADYDAGRVKRHEKISHSRAEHLSRHFEALGVQSSPIAVSYRSDPHIRSRLDEILGRTNPLVSFVSGDGLDQTVWMIDEAEDLDVLCAAFSSHDFYIMDGHHRAAAAGQLLARVGEERGGKMLCVAFADDRLNIEPFHRRVLITAELDVEPVAEALIDALDLTADATLEHELPAPGHVGVHLDGQWWCGTMPPPLTDSPIDSLDPVRLQNQVIGPVLGIDPEQGAGQIRYFLDNADRAGLAQRIDRRNVLFLLRPLTAAEVFAVADAGLDMPPKSTYVTPKPRSGVFLRRF